MSGNDKLLTKGVNKVGPIVAPLAATAGDAAAAGGGAQVADTSATAEIVVDANKYPESAQHISDAQAAGQPATVTIDRAGASARRAEALASRPTVAGMDRDEYPPAIAKEGGKGASVRSIRSSDNRGAGASMGNQLRSVPNGATAKIVVKFPTDGGGVM